MRVLFYVLLMSGVATLPFLLMRRPWALRIWRKARLFLIVYVVAVLLAAIVALVARWDQIYG